MLHDHFAAGLARAWRATAAILALTLTLLVSLSWGPVSTSLTDTLHALTHWGAGQPGTTLVVQSIRLPRVVLAMLVGATLSLAGSVMQALFRNPLAEPGITGVSSGAATAAVAVIITGVAAGRPWLLALAAFAGAALAVTLVQSVAALRGGPATLLLVGIALNAFLGAVIAALIANAPTGEDAQQAVFWLNGDLTGSTWGNVALVVVPMALGCVVLCISIPELNLFLLTDEAAAATGVNIGRVRHLLLAAAALVTGAGVAVTGVISFVGLVVPHMVRLVLGPDHRRLIPTSMVVGAIFLALADLVARNLFSPVVLQTGTVTALVGAPVLLYLVIKEQRA